MAQHSITVSARVRPLNQRERDSDSVSCVEVTGSKILLHSQDVDSTNMEFVFDQSYWSCNSMDPHYAGQVRLFEDIGSNVVQCAAEGYNACVFAYGQTGSGKTHTMMGSRDEQGLVPRICRGLLDVVQQGTNRETNYRITLSFLEIYNEKIVDLLFDRQCDAASSQSSKTRKSVTDPKQALLNKRDPKKLQIRRSKKKGIHVPDLTQVSVASFEEVEELLRVGNARRSTAGTRVNAQSSRSHAVLTLTCSQARMTQEAPCEINSKLHLVDLAGSERVKVTGVTGARLTEGCHINRSLSALSKVLYTLSEGKAAAHVPYRDSLLTQLLQDSLGGNSKTFMIATISPASQNYKESLSTLRYASRTKLIVNKPTINEDPQVKLIRELREQIELLETELQQCKVQQVAPEAETELTEKQHQEQKLTRRWHLRWESVDHEDLEVERPESCTDWLSPIMDNSRIVKRLEYPEPTDSGLASPNYSDDDDEGLSTSGASFHSTVCHSSLCSLLHDDDENCSPSSATTYPLSSSSDNVRSASGESADDQQTKPKAWPLRDQYSTPTRGVADASHARSPLRRTPPNTPRSICTQTSPAVDRVDELVHHYSLLEKDVDFDITDISSAADLSNTSIMLPGNESSRKMALIIEKEVQRRVSMSFSNSSFNGGKQRSFASTLPTSLSNTFSFTSTPSHPAFASSRPNSISTSQSGVPSPATGGSAPSTATAPTSRPRTRKVEVSHDYSVDISCAFRHKGPNPLVRYYQVDLRAGSSCWKVYKRFSDVVVMKNDLEKQYPVLRPVFEQHAALLSRSVEDLRNQPSKQELKMFLSDLLTLLTHPTSSWSPLSSGPPSEFELRGLHGFFHMGVNDSLRSFVNFYFRTTTVSDSF